MPTRAEFIAKAREYLGTPFHHQGRVKGVGVDCSGLVKCTSAELGIVLGDRADYGRYPDGQLEASMREAGLVEIPVADARDADVLCATFEGETRPGHLLVLCGNGTRVIHTWTHTRRVVEHAYDERWRARIVSAWRLPGIED